MTRYFSAAAHQAQKSKISRIKNSKMIVLVLIGVMREVCEIGLRINAN